MLHFRFRSFVRFSRIAFAAVVAASFASAQEKRPMTIVDLLDMPQVGSPRLSPDGTELLYTRADTDWEKNGHTTHIHRVGTDGSGDVRLTNGEHGESHPRWSPDGTRVAFLARRGEGPFSQIHLMRNRGGEAAPLTDHGSSVQSFAFSPDGNHIFFLAPDPKTAEEKKKDELQDDVFAFDEDYKQRHLFRVAVAEEGSVEAERITEGDYSVLQFRLSDDGMRIAHSRAPSPLFDNRDEGEVWIMDADGGNALQLTDNTVSEFGAQLSPDGTRVMFLSDSSADLETYFNDNIFLVPAAGGPHRLLFEDMPHEVTGARWAPDGSIWFTANTGVRTQLFHAGIEDAAPTALTDGDHSLSGWNFQAAAGKHVFGISNPKNNGDVHLLPADGGTRCRSRASSTISRRPSCFRSRKRSAGRAKTASKWRVSSITPSTTRRAGGIRSWSRPTADRRPPTSSPSDAGAVTRRFSPRAAGWSSSPTTGAAPVMATISSATWWATTSTRPISM